MDENLKRYFENPRTITEVQPLENYGLLITFDNGEKKKYDMQKELTGIFSVLKDKEKFNQVFINAVGNVAWNIDASLDSSVHWENEIDICKDMLYLDGIAYLC